MNNKKCCIVIPAYKNKLDNTEKMALVQLSKICGTNHNIHIVCPPELDVTEYRAAMSESEEVLYADRFDSKYFKSTQTYSQLCTSYDFYNQFSEYEFMLIYQADCWIFEDQIDEWCDKGYDYVGAPVLTNYVVWVTTPTVGNGGLSLRRISTFKDITDPDGELLKNNPELDPTTVKIEDTYFCEYVYEKYDFKKPRYKTASAFAWDMDPEECYRLNGNNLPMGLHAWDKNIHFLATLVESFDDEEIIRECEERWKDSVYEFYMTCYKEAYAKVTN